MPGWWCPISASLQPTPGHGGWDEGPWHRAGTRRFGAVPCQGTRGEECPGHGQRSLSGLSQRDLCLQAGGVTAPGAVGSLMWRGDGADLEGDWR